MTTSQVSRNKGMQKKRVLIVDDDPVFVKLLQTDLHVAGYEALSAKDGYKGIEAAQKELPDLIIMDIDLPKMNGYEAAKSIKAAPETAGTPIVAVTARTVKFSAEMAEEAGCADFITKPYRLNFIRERLAPFL